jgi:hypothetical protein
VRRSGFGGFERPQLRQRLSQKVLKHLQQEEGVEQFKAVHSALRIGSNVQLQASSYFDSSTNSEATVSVERQAAAAEVRIDSLSYNESSACGSVQLPVASRKQTATNPVATARTESAPGPTSRARVGPNTASMALGEFRPRDAQVCGG